MNAAGAHLDAAVASLLTLSKAERIEAILCDRFVHHERANALIEECNYLALRPRSLRPRGLLICGLSNAGKTAFSEALSRSLESLPPTAQQPATLPYVLISVVSARDAGEIMLRFLEALGCPAADRYTAAHRQRKAFQLAKLAQVRALIVDELQDLVNITPRQRVLTLLALKGIMNSLRLPIIALGTPEAQVALQADPHLNARFDFRDLPVWECDDYLAHFLEAYESSLPLERRSHLSSLPMMRLIIRSTGGSLGDMVMRLQTAAALAVESGEERITEALFRRSQFEFPRLSGSPSVPTVCGGAYGRG